MKISSKVKNIINCYEDISNSCKINMIKLLMHGKLGGSGKLVILPVDQGFEHGPARSFAINSDAYDPHYHFQVAIESGLSAYAAPLGMLEAGIDTYINKIPTILKLNSSNSWSVYKDQAITASVSDAKRLGCVGVGFTIYPGSEHFNDLVEEFRDIAAEARSEGLISVLWSYPRGGKISKKGETALDVTAYAAHMAALLGAHIIKVKPPTAHLEQKEAKCVYEEHNISREHLKQRVAHVMQSAFNYRRIVVFSGGTAKDDSSILNEIQEIALGGGSGSIIGRNCFQRKYEDSLLFLNKVIKIYLDSH